VASLGEIIAVVQPEQVIGLSDIKVEAVACHPANMMGSHCIFVCMDEYLEYNRWQTWRTHLEALEDLKPAALVVPEAIDGLTIPQLVVKQPRLALGRIARLLTGAPDNNLYLVGVTGTNGKTTTTRILAHLLSKLGQPCGCIGTLGVSLTDRISLPGTYTTPLAPQVYEDLAQMSSSGAEAVAMEVSSHGLALDRVEGIIFDAAILTNVERDHLDFHGTPEAYAEAKRRLFGRVKEGGICVLNRGSQHYAYFEEAASGNIVSYGELNSGADLELVELVLGANRSQFKLQWKGRMFPFETRLVGKFQIENTMAAIALLAALGYDLSEIAEALVGFEPVCGRMERFTLPGGATAIVDYAHNPDGLSNVLQNCRLLCEAKLHVVFGCGGDRDRGKRSIMGNLAVTHADVAWVTSDNPRTEEPSAIIQDILEGCQNGHARVVTEPDRAQAIRKACAAAGPGDLVLIAGKGHEDYQLIGYTKFPFSDQAIVRELGGC
jgi:UDP-N-acetylmuramoyl-L-alanyl-D-glutamate--2,6-diaminopimelate ligase